MFEDIVDATKAHKNNDRLDWHLFNISHHCSYTALGPEKGEKETKPTQKVEELLLHGKEDAYMVSSSDPIPDDKEAYRQEQPPHIQARNTYERYLEKINGLKFLITMEQPITLRPRPIVFEISGKGLRRKGKSMTGAAVAVSSVTPRAG